MDIQEISVEYFILDDIYYKIIYYYIWVIIVQNVRMQKMKLLQKVVDMNQFLIDILLKVKHNMH